MNCSIANFLVMRERVENHPVRDSLEIGETANRANSIFNPDSLFIGEPSGLDGNSRRSNHSVAHSLAVRDATVVRGSLERMPDGVTEIEYAPFVALFFIRH